MPGLTSKTSLVSIGIPTCNRSAGLRVAVESALTQDHDNLEIIISDNASTDNTRDVAESLCKADSRVRYFRQQANIGPTANFDAARQPATGKYFVWLADDDWFDPGYVRRCQEELEANPDHALVCGRIRYYKQGKFCFDGQTLNTPARAASKRVIQFYRQVSDCGAFYGLTRREQTRSIPCRNIMGWDWIFLATVTFMGKVRTLPDVVLHRDFTWDENSFQRYAKSMGLPAFQEREPYLSIAISAYRDIRHGTPVYQQLGGAARWWLACRAWRILCRRHGLRLPKLLKIYFSELERKPA